jgi:hypothetical protein
MKRRLGVSQAGNVMLTAMVVATMVVWGAASAFHRFGDTKESFRAARIKSLMSVLEAQVRNRARQPEAYTGCANGSGCAVNPNFFADIQHQVISGAACPPEQAKCGILLSLQPFQAATSTFQAAISYEGKETKPKPLSLSINVPLEVLQADVFRCGLLNPNLPVFTGFTASTGAPICKGFNTCGAGQFASGVNVSSRTLKCKSLPSALRCSMPQMVSSLGWSGDALSVGCSDRPDPPYDYGLGQGSACPTQTMQDLYNTALKTYTATQGNIGAACIENNAAADTLEKNLALTNQFEATRFKITCASRWCDQQSGDSGSVGFVPSALTFLPGDAVNLDPNGNVSLECFTNHVQNTPAACQTIVENNPPLAVRTLSYGGANCAAYCGCDLPSLSNQYLAGPEAPVSCGTRYCQDQDFKWGVLSEMNNLGFVIRCSKSQALY